jgi:hypothetical protein
MLEPGREKFGHRWFWRVIYRQKYPEADQISFEDVLVFEKPL